MSMTLSTVSLKVRLLRLTAFPSTVILSGLSLYTGLVHTVTTDCCDFMYAAALLHREDGFLTVSHPQPMAFSALSASSSAKVPEAAEEGL